MAQVSSFSMCGTKGGWQKAVLLLLAMALIGCVYGQELKEPPYVDPGPPGGPPADATRLVDRYRPTLDPWRQDTTKGWEIEGNVLKAPAEGVALVSKQSFGDVQLHVEFRVTAEGQALPSLKLAAGAEVPGPGEGTIVTPGETDTSPPADAVVLFDGKSLDQWVHPNGRPARWEIIDGVLQCKPGTGNIISKEVFRDARLHVEFATPYMPDARGQGRGNSGVYLQGRYEVQVLDSYQNKTYFDGQCGAIYRQYPPLVNVCRPPLQWQTYDIIFRAPRCDESGRVLENPRATVLHNGVLIHDDVEIHGPTGGHLDENVCAPGPLMLQDHGNTVRFRNIWLRHLDEQRSVREAPRAVGEWQTYDVIFRAPRLDDNGRVRERGRLTVLHNGVLIRNRVPVGPAVGEQLAEGVLAPIVLPAGHLEYRNVWMR